MRAPLVFCPNCARYLGAAPQCVWCGWDRPAADRIPSANVCWRVRTAAPPDGRPLLLGDAFVLPDRKGGLTVVDAATGEVRARWPGEGPLRAGLAGRGDRFYAAQREGALLAFTAPPADARDAALTPAWRYPLPSPGAPAVDEDGRIYIGDGEGRLHALLDEAGRPELLAPPVAVRGRVAVAPVRWRSLLLVATSHSDGYLLALDVGRAPSVVWTSPIGARAAGLLLAHRRGRADAREGTTAAVALTDRGQARAFTLPGLEALPWRHEAGGGAHAAVTRSGPRDDEGLYLAAADGMARGINPLDGKALWQPVELGEAAFGLAAWDGLLLAAGRGGLRVIDAANGAPLERWTPKAALTAGPVVFDGLALIGDEAGWIAAPWHLGAWGRAAARFRASGDAEAAGACLALAGDFTAATNAWSEAGAHERPAWFWTAQGDDRRAAAAFQHAAGKVSGELPGLAAAYLNQAADRLEAANALQDANELRARAGRIGQYPYLRLRLLNVPVVEAGEKMTLEVEIKNIGYGPAENLHFRVGGRLAHGIAGELTTGLAPGRETIVAFENLIPTAAGKERVNVSVWCGKQGSSGVRADLLVEFDVAAPPPGAITVKDDAGAVIVRVPKGAPLPNVRVGGMATMVKVEYT